MLYVLCGVSGVGKTTVLNALLQRQPLLGRLITSTTRPPRPGEIDQIDYHFLSVPHFQSAVQRGQLVCPIKYRGAWYATARDDLARSAHRDMMTVLRPDKLNELQQFTPLLGIYILRAEQCSPLSQDDQIIVDHRHLCLYQITNVPGNIDVAVAEILALIQTYAGG